MWSGPLCPACQRPFSPMAGVWLCQRCLERIPIIRPPICETCGKPLRLTSRQLCEDCSRSQRLFARARAVALYDGFLRELIQQLKFGGRRTIARGLGTLMGFVARSHSHDICRMKPDLLIPVPLAPGRLRERGFNQAELLADNISGYVDRPVLTTALVRRSDTQVQSRLSGHARRRNLAQAFEVVRPAEVAGRRILLIDDVLTTGATCNECSRALLRAGASEVEAFVMAVGVTVRDWWN